MRSATGALDGKRGPAPVAGSEPSGPRLETDVNAVAMLAAAGVVTAAVATGVVLAAGATGRCAGGWLDTELKPCAAASPAVASSKAAKPARARGRMLFIGRGL